MSDCGIIPLRDLVVVEISQEDTVTKGGLYIPVSFAKNDKPSAKGVVVAVGDEVRVLKEGDVIMFKNYEGQSIKYKDKSLVVIDEVHVLGKFKDEVA